MISLYPRSASKAETKQAFSKAASPTLRVSSVRVGRLDVVLSTLCRLTPFNEFNPHFILLKYNCSHFKDRIAEAIEIK